MVVFCSSIYLLAFICAPLSTHAQCFRGGGGGAPPAGFSVPNAPRPSVASIPQSVQPSSIPVVPNPIVIQQNPNVVQTSPAAVQSNPTVVQQKAAVVQASPSPGNSTPSQASTASSSCGACTGSRIEIQWSGDVVSYSWSGGSGQTNTGECLSLGSNWEGQVAVGGSGGTIFESNPSKYFDVSFILGWSLPMVCCSGGAKSGCSLNLGSMGSCPSRSSGGICKNPTGPGGSHDPGSYSNCASCISWCYACSPPDLFFAPCSWSAYTYPYDDGRRSAQLREL